MLNLYLEDAAAARRLRKLLRIAACGLVVLAVAGVWIGRPLYRHFKEQRLAALAQRFLQAGQRPNALFTAKMVLALDRTNLAACEVMADLADSARSSETLAWRSRVAELAPTFDHRMRLAAAALSYEPAPHPLARQILDAMSAADRCQVSYHLLASRLALRLHQEPDALFHLNEAIRLEPTNTLYRVLLAQLRLDSPNAGVAAAARKTLDCARTNPLCRAVALRSLVAASLNRHADASATRRFSEELLALPESGFDDRMTHLSLLHQMGSADFQPFLAALQKKCATNAVQAGQLALWMAAQGTPDQAVAWLRRLDPPLQTQPPAALALAWCLAEGQRWRELEARLREQKWIEQDYLRLAFLALAARQRHDETAARELWQAAARQASERAESLYALVETAQRWRWESETQALLWTTVSKFPRAAWARSALEQCCAAHGDTAGLYRLYSVLWRQNPADVFTKNNLAAVALLLQTNLPQAYQLAREAYAANRRNGAFVGTYTYALHLQGKSPDALEAWTALPSSELERPSVAVYYGVELAEAGQPEKAKPYLARAEKAALLPEERALLVRAAKRL